MSIWKRVHDFSVDRLGYEPADIEWLRIIREHDHDIANITTYRNFKHQISTDRIGSVELRNILRATLGDESIRELDAADTNYKLVDVKHFKEWLEVDYTDTIEFVNTVRDCDDFQVILQGHVTEWDSDLCFGTLWVRKPTGGHALNWMITTDKQLLLVEPQTNQVFKFPSNWKFYRHLYIS